MGTLWRLSGTIERDDADARIVGAKLYIFDSTTTTPRKTYSDAGLTVERTHPVLTDADGRWPTIFLQYGTYRERRTNASGSLIIEDADEIPNPAPPAAPSSVDPNALISTGHVIWRPFDETIDGFVRCNGRTIGSGLSGASEWANDDTEDLFLKLWNGLSDSVCPVTTGRGGTAALDWAANKKIATPDLRAYAIGGLDTMGNGAASRFDASVPFAVGNSSTAGSTAGLNHHALTTAQLSSHSHALSSGSVTAASNGAHTHDLSGGGVTAAVDSGGAHEHNLSGGTSTGAAASGGAHTHTISSSVSVYAVNGVGPGGVGGGANAIGSTLSADSGGAHTHTLSGHTDSGGSHSHTLSGATASNGAHTHTVSGTSDTSGSGNNHNNTQRTMLGTFYMKL